MHIHLNHHSGEPIYRQIVEAIKFRIASGELAEGTRLPSIRDLARQLEINMRTAAKAYQILEQAGLVVMQQGRGVFVTSPQAVLPARRRRTALSEQIRRLLAEATGMGATPEEVLEIMKSEIEEMWSRNDE
jgi:GntR family transcriptional regulator